MGNQPGFERGRRPIGQQIDHMMILKIHEDCAVRDVAMKCQLVHSQVGWSSMGRELRSPNEPQKRICTTGDLESTGNTSTLLRLRGQSQVA